MANDQHKRKIQYYEHGQGIWCYWVKGQKNPCNCGSNVFHQEYDGKTIYGVCNACNTDIYEIQSDTDEELSKGIWK